MRSGVCGCRVNPFDTHHIVNIQSNTPNGDTWTGHCPDGTDPTSLVIVWAWSSSNEAWLRQSFPVPAAEALANLQSLLIDLPNVRPCLSPCFPA